MTVVIPVTLAHGELVDIFAFPCTGFVLGAIWIFLLLRSVVRRDPMSIALLLPAIFFALVSARIIHLWYTDRYQRLPTWFAGIAAFGLVGFAIAMGVDTIKRVQKMAPRFKRDFDKYEAMKAETKDENDP